MSNDPAGATDRAVADAQDKLARLHRQIQAMQALLVQLLQDVARAEKRLECSEPARLVEVNEQLVVAALVSQADAAAAAQALKDAAQSAGLDALTRLPNRITLRDRFAQAAANARRHDSRFALLFMDLDRFKQLNDTHGHPFGDQVLCLVAERLVGAVREVDTVSRHGGDEFLILVTELSQPGDAQTVVNKLIAAVGAPAELDGRVVRLAASIGVAVYPDDDEDLDRLIALADAAMYRSKHRHTGAIGSHGSGPGLKEPGPQT